MIPYLFYSFSVSCKGFMYLRTLISAIFEPKSSWSDLSADTTRPHKFILCKFGNFRSIPPLSHIFLFTDYPLLHYILYTFFSHILFRTFLTSFSYILTPFLCYSYCIFALFIMSLYRLFFFHYSHNIRESVLYKLLFSIQHHHFVLISPFCLHNFIMIFCEFPPLSSTTVHKHPI